MLRLTRGRTAGGVTTTEVVYGITGLPRGRADAHRLPGLARRHRGVENGLHDVRDVASGEDARRVRPGSAPRVLAAVRNAAPHLLGGVNRENIAAAIRHLAAEPSEALRPVCPKAEN